MTPCTWRSVKVVGTCTRRQIIGLTPTSHTLICRISPQTGTGVAVALSADGCCRLLTRTAYPGPAAVTPHFFMLYRNSLP